jgi:hypothetical protein
MTPYERRCEQQEAWLAALVAFMLTTSAMLGIAAVVIYLFG